MNIQEEYRRWLEKATLDPDLIPELRAMALRDPPVPF